MNPDWSIVGNAAKHLLTQKTVKRESISAAQSF
jgi:hypothetical protein